MHFDDLEPCVYHRGALNAASWAVPLHAVGWLEATHGFTSGDVPGGLVSKLVRMVEQTERAFPHYVFRGGHDCSLCVAENTWVRTPGWSQANLIVPGTDEVFAAPSGVVHYIEHHRYQPPQAFIAAVSTCPDCDSPSYLAALHHANRGLDIPMESNEAYMQRSRERLAAAVQRGAEARERAASRAEATPAVPVKGDGRDRKS